MRAPSVKKILPRIAKVSRTVEYILIYAILVGVIIFELLSSIFVNIRAILTNVDLILVIILVLLLIFRYLDNKLGLLEKLVGPTYCGLFNDGMNAIFTKGEKVNTIDFFGLSSWLFQTSVETRGITAKKVRILLKNPRQASNIIPADPQGEQKLKNQIETMCDAWQLYQKNSFIKQLQIHFYDFEPLFFGVIVDKKKGVIGFYQPTEKFPFYLAMTCFVLTDGTDFERKALIDFQQWFEGVFKRFTSANSQFSAIPKT
jgi:hypothetical protein